MTVISKLDLDGQDILKYENSTIREIYHDGTIIENLPAGTYHFAKVNETTGIEVAICENSVNEPIVDMQISGKSFQDSGKNILPRFLNETKNGITLEWQEDGTLRVYGTATADAQFYTPYIKVQANPYYLSGCPAGGSSSTYRFLVYFQQLGYNMIDYGTGKAYTSKVESSLRGDLKIVSGQTVDLIFKPMLEIGTTGTEYVPFIEPTTEAPVEIQSVGEYDESTGKYKIPITINATTTNIYLNEPLRKIGDYADIIDYKNKKVIRQIKEVKLTGNEDWVRTSTQDSYSGGEKRRFYYRTDIMPSYDVVTKSNKYKGVKPVDTWNCVNGVSTNNAPNKWLIIYNEDTALFTLAEFKAYIKEQYNNRNPIIVDYVMETPAEENLDLPELYTLDGTSTIATDTTIKPSQITVDYWKQI